MSFSLFNDVGNSDLVNFFYGPEGTVQSGSAEDTPAWIKEWVGQYKPADIKWGFLIILIAVIYLIGGFK